MQRWGKYVAAGATVVSSLLAVLLTFQSLGQIRAIWALVGAAAVGLSFSVAGLWFARKTTIAAYTRGAEADWLSEVDEPRDSATSAAYQEFLSTQVVPAFVDGGLDR